METRFSCHKHGVCFHLCWILCLISGLCISFLPASFHSGTYGHHLAPCGFGPCAVYAGREHVPPFHLELFHYGSHEQGEACISAEFLSTTLVLGGLQACSGLKGKWTRCWHLLVFSTTKLVKLAICPFVSEWLACYISHHTINTDWPLIKSCSKDSTSILRSRYYSLRSGHQNSKKYCNI